MSVKSEAIKAELRATAYMIGGTVPQFIHEDEDLKQLIEYIKDFRAGILPDKPREESLAVIDGFLSALLECFAPEDAPELD